MILVLEDLRALAELKRTFNTLAEAKAAYLEAEAACWRRGIGCRQIAAVTGDNYNTVYRRVSGRTVKVAL